MKILHINMDFLPSVGGAQMSVHQLALGQTQAGHDVTVLTSRKCAKRMRGILPYKVVPVFHRSSHMFRARDGWMKKVFFDFQANRKSREKRFDICHLHGAMPEGSFIDSFKKTGAKVVMTLRGDDIGIAPEIGYGARLVPAKNNEIVKRVTQCDHMIALTDHWADEMEKMGADRQRIATISNGVRLERFEQNHLSRKEVRSAYGLDQDKVIIASIGRNHPVKGYNIIPKAVQLLLDKGKDFVWVLIGPQSEDLNRTVQLLGLKNYIRTFPPITPTADDLIKNDYLLPLPDMVSFLKALDIVAIPSLSEVCCNGALEAMAAGTTLVGSDIPGITFVLEDGVSGLSFPPKDDVALANALMKLIDDSQLRNSLSANGLYAVSDLSWQKIVARHLELYESLI